MGQVGVRTLLWTACRARRLVLALVERPCPSRRQAESCLFPQAGALRRQQDCAVLERELPIQGVRRRCPYCCRRRCPPCAPSCCIFLKCKCCTDDLIGQFSHSRLDSDRSVDICTGYASGSITLAALCKSLSYTSSVFLARSNGRTCVISTGSCHRRRLALARKRHKKHCINKYKHRR